MTTRTSGSDGATFELTISDTMFKSILQLAQEQLSVEAVGFLSNASTVSVVLAPASGVVEIRRNYAWCTSFLVSAEDDRVSELAWAGVLTKLLVKAQTGTLLVRFLITTQ